MNRKIDSSVYRSAAKEAYISANHTSAYLKYTRALKNQQDDHSSLHKIFAILYHQQKYKLAETQIRKVLIISPNNPRAYYNRGVVLDILGQYKESEIAYRQCIKYDKKMRHRTSYRNLAAVLMKQGRYVEALRFCHKAIRLVSRDGIAYNVLGYIHVLQGEYGKALESFEKGIQLTPNECIIYLNKAIVLYLLEQKEEVRSTLEMMKRVMEKIGKRDFKEEIEVFSKEVARLENEGFEGMRMRACIQGIQFIMNFVETEFDAHQL